MGRCFPSSSLVLTGIARLAEQAPHADDGHLVEFRAMQVRSILNKTVSKRFRSLEYSINPYRGCEFGCRYCYARYAHGFLAPKLASAQRDGAVGTVPGAAAGPGEWVSGPVAADFAPDQRWPAQGSPIWQIVCAVQPGRVGFAREEA